MPCTAIMPDVGSAAACGMDSLSGFGESARSGTAKNSANVPPFFHW